MKQTFWILLALLLLASCDRAADTVSAPSAASSAEARALLEEVKARLMIHSEPASAIIAPKGV